MEICTTRSQGNLGAASPIGILGASSVVAQDLTRLLSAEHQTVLFSLGDAERKNRLVADDVNVSFWISVIPIWAIPNPLGGDSHSIPRTWRLPVFKRWKTGSSLEQLMKSLEVKP